MQERRSRIRFNVPVLIEFPNPVTYKTERSYTHDVSDSGLRFPTTVKLAVGQEVALSLELPYKNATMQATGEVIWIREIGRITTTQYEVGVRFRWIEDPDRQRMNRFLQNFTHFSSRL